MDPSERRNYQKGQKRLAGMMYSRSRRRVRTDRGFPLFLFMAGIIAVFMCGIFFFPVRRDRRINIAVASSPVMVWSYDTAGKTIQVITIPEDTVVDGAYGYGQYSLGALWKLGVIDHKGGSVFADSLSNAFGVPIHFYIGPTTDELIPVSKPAVFARTFFSWTRLYRFFSRQFETNMTFRSAVALTQAATQTTSDSTYVTDFVSRPMTYDMEMPDNTTQHILDTERVDAVLKGKFDDPIIRKEALSVALYNSTRVPVLATRAARILTSAGILVISLDNSDRPVDACQIAGEKDAVTSETSKEIAGMLGCVTQTVENHAKADLVVTIGTEFAKRFVAKQDIVR